MKKIKRYYYLLPLLLASIILIGCKRENMADHLEQIDSLLVNNKVDSARNLLIDIPIETIHYEIDSAYYFLLMTEANYRKWIPIKSDSAINFCIKCYEKYSNNEKLARAYYYKGVALYSSQGIPQTISYLKQAEEKANKTDNLYLIHKVLESLSLYNSMDYEYKLALIYAKKAQHTALKLDNKERQAIALSYMAGNYSRLGMKDSLAICIQQCLPLLDFIGEDSKAYLYTRIGELYEETEPIIAKKYLLRAIEIRPQSWTYRALSNLYLKEDSLEKAKDVWKKALQMNGSMKVKFDILKAMRQQSLDQKDFQQANVLADSIIKMEERFYEVQRKDQIAEIQAKYDKETAVRDLREKYMTWGLGFLALTTIIVTFLGYKSRQGMKAKKELAESKIQLDAYTKKAAELESSGKASATEINKLHEKINELTHRHSGILAKGKELYDAIEAGSTTVHWTKDDFINYLEYYKMTDLPFVNEMETEYNRLSPKYIFFAVLEHEGKSDEDILRIMGISESTLRSTRSRINSKKL